MKGNPMYIRANGQPYVRFLEQLHNANLFDWYNEIGCRTGRTLAPVRSRTVAADPFFQAEADINGSFAYTPARKFRDDGYAMSTASRLGEDRALRPSKVSP